MLFFLAQKQSISSEKSDILSSLVKLKDVLQSKDHKKAAVKEVSIDIYLSLLQRESWVFSGHRLLSDHKRR